MNWLYRKMLLVASLLAFVLIAPMIVLYAVGYRLGTASQAPQPVGVIVAESIPRRAMVTVNNMDIGRTPRAVPGLRPGPASLMIAKEGYLPWRKTITVEPTLISEFRGVRLWPSSLATQVVSFRVARYAASPNRRLLAVQNSNQQVVIYDDAGQVVVPAVAAGRPMTDITFSTDNAYVLLIDTAGRGWVLEVSNPAVGLRPLAISSQQLVWDPRLAGRLLALSVAGDLEIIQVATGVKTAVALDVRLIAPSSRYLYAWNKRSQLIQYGLAGEELGIILTPADWKLTHLLVTADDRLGVLLDDGRLLVRSDRQEWQLVAESVQRAGWSPDGQMLWLQRQPNELAVVNIDNENAPHIPLGEFHFVTRLSRPITYIQWFAGGAHLLYQVDDQLVISEIDTRDHSISYTVDSTNRSDAQAAVGEDGEALYYLKNTGSRTDLIKTDLLVEE